MDRNQIECKAKQNRSFIVPPRHQWIETGGESRGEGLLLRKKLISSRQIYEEDLMGEDSRV